MRRPGGRGIPSRADAGGQRKPGGLLPGLAGHGVVAAVDDPNDVRRLEDQDPSDDEGADELVTVRRFTGQKPGDGGQGGAPGAEDDAAADA